MSTPQFEEVREFQKTQVDAAAKAALAAANHLAKLTEIQMQASKELIGLLQSHTQQVLSAKDFGGLAQTHSNLISTLVANSTKVSQDLFAAGSQYAKESKEQATAAMAQTADKAGEAGKAVQQAFANGAQAFTDKATAATSKAQ